MTHCALCLDSSLLQSFSGPNECIVWCNTDGLALCVFTRPYFGRKYLRTTVPNKRFSLNLGFTHIAGQRWCKYGKSGRGPIGARQYSVHWSRDHSLWRQSKAENCWGNHSSAIFQRIRVYCTIIYLYIYIMYILRLLIYLLYFIVLVYLCIYQGYLYI